MLLPSVPSAIGTLEVDKVLKVFTGTFTIPAMVGFTPGEDDYDVVTGIPELCLFYGRYSVDAGTTWTDFSSLSNVTPGFFGYTDVWCKAQPGVFRIMGLNYIAFTQTVLFEVCAIATKDHTWADYGESATPLQFQGLVNYTKIALDLVQDETIPANTRSLFYIGHGLGYVPTVRCWILNDFDGWLYDGGQLFKGDGYSMFTIDVANFIYVLSNEGNPSPRNFTLYTRVYFDD